MQRGFHLTAAHGSTKVNMSRGRLEYLQGKILEFTGKMVCMSYSWGPLMLLRGNPAYRAAADANGSRHALCLFRGQKNQDV